MGDPLVGKVLCGYRVEELLARGPRRSVYRATQLSVDRPVALEVLSPEASKDRGCVLSFLEEARRAGRLKHPGLVDHHEVLRQGDLVFSSREYLPGGSLEDAVERDGPLPWARVLALLQSVVQALAWMEGQGSNHGRMTPRRILLGSDGRWRLLLGVSESARGEAGPAKELAFAAPERLRGSPADSRSDIYSLGCVSYYALSGRTPFRGESREEILAAKRAHRVAPLAKLRPETPRAVLRLVERMMAFRPERRFSSFAALGDALQSLVDHARGGSPPPERRKSRLARRAAAALLVLALAAGVAAALGRRVPRAPSPERAAPIAAAERTPGTPHGEARGEAPHGEARTGAPSATAEAKGLPPEVVVGASGPERKPEREPEPARPPEPTLGKERIRTLRGVLWEHCAALDFAAAERSLSELEPEAAAAAPEEAAEARDFLARAKGLWARLEGAHPWASSAVPPRLAAALSGSEARTFASFRAALLKAVVDLYLERLAERELASPFRGKTELGAGRSVRIAYEFDDEAEALDFVAPSGAQAQVAVRGGRLELEGECRFLDSNPFRGAISAALVVSGCDASAPDVNLAFWTQPGSPVAYDPDAERGAVSGARGSRESRWDYLVLGFGYGPRRPLVPSLKVRDGAQRVLFPCVAVLGGRAGKALHDGLDWDCWWGANYLGELRGPLALRAAVGPEAIEWEANGRKLHAEIPPETLRRVLAAGPADLGGRAGSFAIFTNGRRIAIESLELRGTLDEAWLHGRLLERALEELEKSAPEIPWRTAAET